MSDDLEARARELLAVAVDDVSAWTAAHIRRGDTEFAVAIPDALRAIMSALEPRPAAPEEREAVALALCNSDSGADRWPGPDMVSLNDLTEHGRKMYLRRADAVLALRPTGSDGWEDISTAPKDGTDILAWCVHRNAEYADTIAEHSDWQAPVVARWIDHNGGGWTWHGLSGRFTHWRALPASPLRSMADGEKG